MTTSSGLNRNMGGYNPNYGHAISQGKDNIVTIISATFDRFSIFCPLPQVEVDPGKLVHQSQSDNYKLISNWGKGKEIHCNIIWPEYAGFCLQA